MNRISLFISGIIFMAVGIIFIGDFMSIRDIIGIICVVEAYNMIYEAIANRKR